MLVLLLYQSLLHPAKVSYDFYMIVVIIMGIIIKILLSMLYRKRGKKVNSSSLIASGLDAFNDALISISVLISTILYMVFNISIEAYVGILVSIFIIKQSFELIKESVGSMVGVRVAGTLTKQIKKEVLKEKNVQGAFDLILNDYGPDRYLGSIHIEVNDNLTVADIDKISRSISKNVLEKYGVILHTIGVYSVNTKDEKIKEMRKDIKKIVFSYNGILEMHGFYVDEKEKTISFDIIIDFEVENREDIYKKIYDEVKNKYKDYKLYITLDVDISD